MGKFIRILEKPLSASLADEGRVLCSIPYLPDGRTGASLVRDAVEKMYRSSLDSRRLADQYSARRPGEGNPNSSSLFAANNNDATHGLVDAVQAALADIRTGRVLMFVRDVQVEDLEKPLPMEADTDVVFVRLIPLKGG